MSGHEEGAVSRELPPGYLAIPIDDRDCCASLRPCVLVRREPDPVGGHFVVLRDSIDGQVFLGCVTDRAGRVHRLSEIWVQNIDGLARRAEAWKGAVCNAALDDRWARHFALLEAAEGVLVTRTGWETQHPKPIFLDLERLCPVHPCDEAGRPWELCVDDRVLMDKKLPQYSSSLHRYLYVRDLGAQSEVAAVTRDAPGSESGMSLTELMGRGGVIPFNPGGGLMMVRECSPIGFEEYADFLGGMPWSGVLHGKTSLPVGLWSGMLGTDAITSQGEGMLFLETHGRCGRMLETFHLKLCLLADAVRAVREVAGHNQRPILNLTADSFRVMLGEAGARLPFLWTAKAVLVNPGNAISVPIEGSDLQLFVNAGEPVMSVYRPEAGGLSISGTGSVRIRRVFSEAGGDTSVEGTFYTQDRVSASPRDLVWLRLALKCGRVDMYAHLEDARALARGESRFRTVPQRLSAAAAEDLSAAEGVPMPHTPFEILPMFNTPCDLYALAVLMIRTLLVDSQNTLPVALDEMLSLARQVAHEHDESRELAPRIKAVSQSDSRWVESLGPQKLIRDDVSVEQAFSVVPECLWWDVLAMIVRMFPGIGPDSGCRDYGDAPRGAVQRVFDDTLSALHGLILRTRSLVVIDWRSNREIGAVISSYLANLPEYEGS